MAPVDTAFAVFAFLSFVLTAIPFSWHLEAWNTGTCIYMGWVSLCSLLLFINTVVWNGNAINSAPIYCDIVAKLFVGLTAAFPAASLCINRRLYQIVNVRSVTKSITDRRKEVFVDLGIGLGLPVIIMILHTVNQGHRYDIYENIGCYPTVYVTPLYYALTLVPVLLIAVVACIYSVLSIIALKRNYTDFKKMLSTNGTNSATASRYIRLMCLASLQGLIVLPLNVQTIISTAQLPMQPWISWDDTHFGFNRVEQFPAFQWRAIPLTAMGLERFRWLVVASGFIFFAFFGFADEAIKNYKLAYNFFARKLGWRLAHIPGSTPGSYNAGGSSSGRSDGGSNGNRNNGNKNFNGTESWMNSFGAFADKVKLVIFPSGPTSIMNASMSSLGSLKESTTREQQHGIGIPIYVSRDMVQTRDTVADDRMSAFTQLTDFTTSTIPGFIVHDEQGRATLVPTERRTPSPYTGNVAEDKADVVSNVDSDESHYSQPSPLPTPKSTTPHRRPLETPLPPPIPPKDPVYSSPLAATATLLAVPSTARLPGYLYDRNFTSSTFAQQQDESLEKSRTPPRQAVPTSVSVSPSPNGSFLDLSTSAEVVDSPLRDVHSADNRV